jgi:hypothetical protein
MTNARINVVSVLGFVAVGAEVYFHNCYLYIAVSSAFMLLLAFGAIVVGRIPRRMRTRPEKIACWIVGWPVFITNLALMAVSCREMWVLNAPEWVLIFAFFWVLAYLTSKVFIDPDTGPGGWWRRRRGHAPKPPAPVEGISMPEPRFVRPVRDNGATVLRGLSAPK